MAITFEIIGWIIIVFELAGKTDALGAVADRFHDGLAFISGEMVSLLAGNLYGTFAAVGIIALPLLALLDSALDLPEIVGHVVGKIDDDLVIALMGSGMIVILVVLMPAFLLLGLMSVHPMGTLSGLGVALALGSSVATRL